MRAVPAPPLERRRKDEFAAELRERARAWIPSWAIDDGERDFAGALLEIAARFNSEVAERLDKAGDKMRRGFLDWLAVRREAARPARMPVVLKLADAAPEPVPAPAGTRMQADANGVAVVFETDAELQVVPGALQAVVAADADKDAYYLAPQGFSSLDPLEPLPTQWQLKSFASAGADKLQLDPEEGLAPEMIVEAAGEHYRVVKVENGIVTIDPPLLVGLVGGTPVRQVTSFLPFDPGSLNRQEHALYLGHTDLLNIEAPGTIEVVGAQDLGESVTWQYWGKVAAKPTPNDEPVWQVLKSEPAADGAVKLTKPKGAVEPRDVKAINSRWIRAFAKSIQGAKPLLRVDTLQLRINCTDLKSCAEEQGPSPAAEAMANTTPLVLDSLFFPLGKEPRQFDAFYLGSPEAFSKKGAQVQLCFDLADPTFAALSRGPWPVWGNLLGGVARDRSLHLLQFDTATRSLKKFRNRDPLHPPLPGFGGSAASTTAATLDAQVPWRLPVWGEGFDFLVATSAGAEVWVWHEKLFDPANSGWIPFGPLPAATTPSAKVDGLVYLFGAPPKIAALRDGKLYVREWPGGLQWSEIDTQDGGNTVVLKTIVPILEEGGPDQLVTSAARGLVGVGDDGLLYRVALDGVCTPLGPTDVHQEVRPVAVQRTPGSPLIVGLVKTTLSDIVTYHSTDGEAPLALDPEEHVRGFDAVTRSGSVHLLATVGGTGGVPFLGSWRPPAAGVPTLLFRALLPASVGEPGGPPTALDQSIVIPGKSADLLAADFDLSRRFAEDALIEPGIVVPASAPALVPNDIVARMAGSVPEQRLITDYGTTPDGEVLYAIDAAFSAGATGPLLAYTASAPRSGTVILPDELQLELGDREATLNSFLLVDGSFHKITNLVTTDPWVATVTPNLAAAGTANYSRPLPTGGRSAPFMRLDPATNGNWDAALLQRTPLKFPGATPEQQSAKAFSTDTANRPILVALGAEFTVAPPGGPTFVADAAVGEWSRILGDTATNPELSWEYWNGTGWWKLAVTLDQTLHLKTSGALRFEVPADMAPTDWSGKNNHWIRARLVGGDYGREKVTVTTSPTGAPNVTQQTVERSSEGIRAPAVVRLHISYRICTPVRPTFVLAQDSGSIRDQSDANRTAGAIVEAFVPLAVTLGRLSGPPTPTEASADCPPECKCPRGGAPATTPLPPGAPATEAAAASGRALFLGLRPPPVGAPVRVLFVVDEEREHGSYAPMAIEALVADRFEPIVGDDGTRAAGETGVLTMAFPVPPTTRELFGNPFGWLRLTPAARGAAGEWKPSLRGAYLNAVWASAAETLTRELLGSSEGAPRLTVRVARPPVLRGSLELRVKEPLGDEDRDLLRKDGPSRVLTDPDGLPGDWVLWEHVIDPADEPAAARAYSLDEKTGVIVFGDGQHGAIPPIGVDSIVAFRYRRTEPGPPDSDGVPANAIRARATLNLVSPVESVEAVFAADDAAGGAPAETDERVLRFGTARLRHRGRAVTAEDIEDLALQSSPDIVQARCFPRRRYVRLVIVMRGKDPRPEAAQRRELQRLLAAASPPALAASRALRIEGPAVRRLRVELRLRVPSLDQAGAVGREAEKRVRALLDTAAGGARKEGWSLGENPGEADVAVALLGTRDLDGIAGVVFREVADDGSDREWPQALKPNELAVLAEDGVRIEFEPVEAVA